MKYDVAILGAGVLGASLAYELSSLTKMKIVLIEMEGLPGTHSSSRNTGIVHRPFYINPKSKALFAKSAVLSYWLWKELAQKYNLPWVQRGVMELAIRENDLGILEKYGRWAIENGMDQHEISILDSGQASSMEPNVSAKGAIFSALDANVDYGTMTNALVDLAKEVGITCLWNFCVNRIDPGDEPKAVSSDGREVNSSIIINVSGGNALKLAKGIATNYAEIHFRGDYWKIADFGGKVSRNIYTVPRNPEYPFLDPHFIIRPDGQEEIGPNAFLVSGPYSYEGTASEILKSIFSIRDDISLKLELFTNSEFISLVWNDWKMSISKKAMVERVRQFIPSLKSEHAYRRGISGIRHSLISNNGFVPEAIVLEHRNTFHVLNYNSPGATGAPIYALAIIDFLAKKYGLKLSHKSAPAWNSLMNIISKTDLNLKPVDI